MISRTFRPLTGLIPAFRRASLIGLAVTIVIFGLVLIIISHFDSTYEVYSEARTVARMASIALESTDSKYEIQRLLKNYAGNRKFNGVYLVEQPTGRIVASSRPREEPFDLSQINNAQPHDKTGASKFLGVANLLSAESLLISQPVFIESFSTSEIAAGKYLFVLDCKVERFSHYFFRNLAVFSVAIFSSLAFLLYIQSQLLKTMFLRPFRRFVSTLYEWDSAGRATLLEFQGQGEIIDLRDSFINLVDRLETAKDLEQQKSNLLTGILNAISRTAIIAFTDKMGRILEVNDNFCQVTGYSKEELVGQDHRILNSGAHPKEFFQDLWKTISSGEVWTGDIENRRKSGAHYIVRTGIAPVRSVQGDIQQYIAIRFDVTEQRMAEIRLNEAQQIANMGSWTLDARTRAMTWSQELYRVLEIDGAKPPHLLWSVLQERIHPEDRGELLRLIERAFESAEGFELNLRLASVKKLRAKNLKVFCRANRGADGRVLYLSGVFQDVTAQVQLESALHLEKAKAAHTAKLASLGEMSAGLAHEINNPLTVITGNISLLLNSNRDPEQFQKRVSSIQRAAERIAKIVRGLQRFSRSSGDRKMDLVNLTDIISEAMDVLEVKSSRQNVPIQSYVNGDLYLKCDSVEVEQVLVNLLSNGIDAVKSTPSPWVKVIAAAEGEEIVLQVMDSGAGIPANLEEKLFQPFFTTKPVGEGTGLGLSIVKGILEEMGASIQVNRAMQNTCFEIRFPRQNIGTEGLPAAS